MYLDLIHGGDNSRGGQKALEVRGHEVTDTDRASLPVRPPCLFDATQPSVDRLAAALSFLAANGKSLTQFRAMECRSAFVDDASQSASSRTS
jgi:hypothetical protein